MMNASPKICMVPMMPMMKLKKMYGESIGKVTLRNRFHGPAPSMAAGVPAVISNGVHLAEAIRAANAGWVTGTSRESIRGGLLQAIQNDGARAAHAVAARVFAAEFAWPAVANRLIALYERTRADAVVQNSGPSARTATAPQPVNR